jgi:hypothetical protein
MLGCWAHARRKFVDVTKAASMGSAAHEAVKGHDIPHPGVTKIPHPISQD